MANKTTTPFMEYVQKERNKSFPSAFELAYKSFIDLGYDKMPKSFFEANASQCVEAMREQAWKEFLIAERDFTKRVLEKAASKINYDSTSGLDSINLFLEENVENMYDLCLSNTQSRRSRAGKEFEAIIELILMGLEIPYDAQGIIGVSLFANKGLGKMVDEVVPGVTHFSKNKRKAILISAKTTLRERWQEVKEEMNRTGAKEMYLASIDEKVSDSVLDQLEEENIVFVTTKAIKDKYYLSRTIAITFEELFQSCDYIQTYWDSFAFTSNDTQEIIDKYDRLIDKYGSKYPYYEKYLKKMKAKF